ncbi:MAG: hypothetical protein LLF82_000307 [Dehalococcoides mccartyi]|nr:hypothetical protein [Dehalococcoides mccartyi]
MSWKDGGLTYEYEPIEVLDFADGDCIDPFYRMEERTDFKRAINSLGIHTDELEDLSVDSMTEIASVMNDWNFCRPPKKLVRHNIVLAG